MGLLGTIGGAVGLGQQVAGKVGSLFGGGGDRPECNDSAPDPCGTKSVGSGQQSAIIFEDRTDQDGNDPAKVIVNGTGSFSFSRIGGQGFWRAVQVNDGFVLEANGLGGQNVTIEGPAGQGRRINLRDRGLSGSAFQGFTVRRKGSSGTGGTGGSGGTGGTGGGTTQAGAEGSNLQMILLGGGLVFLAGRAFDLF